MPSLGWGEILLIALFSNLFQQIVGNGSRQWLAGAENPHAFFLGERRPAANRAKGNAFTDAFVAGVSS